MAICIDCQHHIEFQDGVACSNSDLPITDFVNGLRICTILNPKGGCKGFKPQSQPESIYKLGEDDYRGPLLPEKEHEELEEDDRGLAKIGAQVINSLAVKGIKIKP